MYWEQPPERMRKPAKKRFVVCIDGTWQRLTQERMTNVATIARSIAHEGYGKSDEPIPQIVIYTAGVGSRPELEGDEARGKKAKSGQGLWGGLFGAGLERELLDTYLRLAFNYNAEDEIYIFGFSRGAFMARSLSGMIGKVGILSRRYVERAPEAFRIYRNEALDHNSREAREFRIKYGKRQVLADGRRVASDYRPVVNYVGIFDTVGQRGVPTGIPLVSELASALRLNKRYAFHSLGLGNHVAAARHALAIDEDRAIFPPTLWDNLNERNGLTPESVNDPELDWDNMLFQQRWFPGGHGDIGGGNATTLPAFPLAWIAEGAAREGLNFDWSQDSPIRKALEEGLKAPTAPITSDGFLGRLSPTGWSFGKRAIAPKDPEAKWFKRPRPMTEQETIATLHRVVAIRAAASGGKYRPPQLSRFAPSLTALAAQMQAAQAMFADPVLAPRD